MYKFKENDIISNTVVANPRYKFSFFNGKAYINDQVDVGPVSTPSLNQTGTLLFNDLNIIFENKHNLFTNLDKQSNKDSYTPIVADARFSFEMKRDFIRKSSVDGYEPKYTTGFGSPTTSSMAKFISLKNSINYRKDRAPAFNFSSYFTETLDLKADTIDGDLLQDINILSIDNIFYGSMIKPGSISLEFYKSGSLLAKAQDTTKTGELIEQTNTTIGTGTVVGFALYEEGIIEP